ncbi:uncharacterized protein LOC141628629 [Silene latifolia]|uniref:uncharacterized protein LOC141628629 n=1 Tax=Silene latifolia TaxID=37657 RepID=UPI003D77C018
MGVINQNLCYFCGVQEESHQHLFFECSYSLAFIQAVSDWCKVGLPQIDCIKWWVDWRQSSMCRKKVVGVILACSMYVIWSARNTCRIEGYLHRPERLGQLVKKESISRLHNVEFKCNSSRVKQWLDDILH